MEESSIRPHETPRLAAAGYFVGLLTGVVVMGLLLVYVGYRAGGPDWLWRLDPWRDTVRVSPEVLSDLVALHAVYSNTRTRIQSEEHNTILVRPDPELGSTLRPGARIAVHLLRTTKPLNVDPPLLQLRADDQVPERVARYLEKETRLQYRYTVDEAGRRTTLPAVDAEQEILLIGDSVVFGVGVDDESTLASHLQRIFRSRYRAVNAGVGGYNGRQAAAMAERLSRDRSWAGLVYVACQNDFMKAADWKAETDEVLGRLAALRDRFDGNVVVVLHTYMEYTLYDFFLERGWSRDRIDRTDALRAEIARSSEARGFGFIDWTDIVNEYLRTSRSVFAPFALYADHCHLSPLGNRLLAESLAATIGRRWRADGRSPVVPGQGMSG